MRRKSFARSVATSGLFGVFCHIAGFSSRRRRRGCKVGLEHRGFAGFLALIVVVAMLASMLPLLRLPQPAAAMPGDLDSDFGSGGIVLSPIGRLSGVDQATVIQPDGKTVVAGYTSDTSSSDFVLARYNTDGGLDSTFGSGGKVVSDFGGGDVATAVALQSDGRIVVGGLCQLVGGQDWLIARYNSNGVLDTTFGNGGNAIVTFSGYSSCRMCGLTIQSDGKVVGVGYGYGRNQGYYGQKDDVLLARFNTDGSFDTNFGSGGQVITQIGTVNDRGWRVSIRPDGKLVVLGDYDAGGPGGSRDRIFLAQYNSNGSLDTGFGSGGIVTASIGDFDGGRDLVLQPDGKMVVTGGTVIGGQNNLYIARFNADGSSDDSFGNGGKTVTSLTVAYARGVAVVLESDGKILVGGHASTGSVQDEDFAVARYNSDGSLDSSFGTDGKTFTQVGSGFSGIVDLAIQLDGKVVAVGYASDGSNSVFGIARYLTEADSNWSAMSSGTSSILGGVWGSSSSDVFAVAYDGTILHYNGSSWSAMSSGTSDIIINVWGSSSSDVFAVDYNGTILHYDGSSWSVMSNIAPTYLYNIWGSSSSDVFVVGYNGTILHYNGSSWSVMSNIAPTYVLGIWGSSSSDVFAVGGDGTTGTILHYDGSSWSAMSSGTFSHLGAVWGTSSSDVFAAGLDGTILHYNGSSWSAMSSGTFSHLDAVWGSSSSDVFAVGGYGTILHYDGSAWNTMTSGTTDGLTGVWGSSSSDVFAVGDGGTILHYSGGAPSQPSNVSPASGVTDVSLRPTLTSTAFSDPDTGDTHAATQWQITTTAGNYSSPVYDSGTDASNLTRITISSGILSYSTTYYWHVRYEDNNDTWSQWSTETSFTTGNASQTVYSALDDFSTQNGNPNGVWSYGWMPTDFSSFNLYANHNLYSWWGWLTNGLDPSVWKNSGEENVPGVPIGWLVMHPGDGTQPSIMRWTSPITGEVDINGEFLPGNSGIMQVAVRQNNQFLWNATDSGTFDLTTTVVAGDTIDFAVYGAYGGGDTPISATITASGAPTPTSTTTNLVSNSNPSTFGQPMSFTATVNPGTATGTVQFSIDGSGFGNPVALSNGSAVSPTRSDLPPGSHAISASYSGDANHSPSTGNLTQTVNKAPTRVTVTSNVYPWIGGQPVSITATVTPTLPETILPTGNVTFQDGSTVLGVVSINNMGQATCTFTPSAGDHTFFAAYDGDGNYLGATGFISSNGPDQQVVVKASVNTRVEAIDPFIQGQPIRFKATLSPAFPATASPNGGTVQFKVDGVLKATASVSNGTAVSDPLDLTYAGHDILAEYSGDSNYWSSTGLLHIRPGYSFSYGLESSANPAFFSQPVTFTYTVEMDPPVYSATGTVNFTIDGIPLAPVTVSNGVAVSPAITDLSIGDHNVTADYSTGDSHFPSSPMTIPLQQAVLNIPTWTVISSSQNPSNPNDPVLFTATINKPSQVTLVPTGTVQFQAGGDDLGGGYLANGTVSSNVTSFPAVGLYNIAATYTTDSPYFFNSSGSLQQSVVPSKLTSTSIHSSSPNNSCTYGDEVTFTATVSEQPPASGVPTGTVQLLDNGVYLGQIPLDSGAAALTTSSLKIGRHTITAVYSGNSEYGSSSAELTQTVNASSPIATQTNLTSSVNPSIYSQPVTFTATVISSAPEITLPPSGTVTFTDTFNNNTTTLATVALSSSGVAAYTTSTLSVGSHNIIANYSGDSNFASSAAYLSADAVLAEPTIQADFTADRTAVVVGQTTQFTNLSSGGVAPLSYQWDFENNGSWDSTDQNPVYSYSSPGTYTAVLKVTDSAANTSTQTKTGYVTVSAGGPPAAPALISPANGASLPGTSVRFEWGSVTGAADYKLLVSTSTNILDTTKYKRNVNVGTATFYDDTAYPANGTKYYWWVWAYAADGSSSAWSEVSANRRDFTNIAGSSYIAAPALVSPANGASLPGTSVRFEWGSVTGAADYKLLVSTSTNILDTTKYKRNVNVGTATFYDDTAYPANGTKYYWWVWAYAADGSSSAWSEVSANRRDFTNAAGTTAIGTPTLGPPANGASVSGTSVTFNWTAVTGAVKYKLLVSTSTNILDTTKYKRNIDLVDTGSGLPTTYVDTEYPANGTKYYWWVWAYAADGSASAWAQVSANGRNFTNAAIGTPTLGPPANGASVSGTSVTFNWTAVTGAVKYKLLVSTSTNILDTTKYKRNIDLVDTGSGLPTTYVDTEYPANGTKYYWWVWAYAADGSASLWSEVSANGRWFTNSA